MTERNRGLFIDFEILEETIENLVEFIFMTALLIAFVAVVIFFICCVFSLVEDRDDYLTANGKRMILIMNILGVIFIVLIVLFVFIGLMFKQGIITLIGS